MHALSVRPQAVSRLSPAILVPALLFWLFTFAALSVWTEMLLGDRFVLFTTRRLLATTAGAIVYAIALAWIRAGSRNGRLNPASIVAAVLPASLLVLGARLAIDRLFYDMPLPFETNFKWVLVWAGYFGMWVSGSLALQLHPRRASPAASCARAEVSAKPAARARGLASAEPAAWDWIVDACAAELAAVPNADRAAIAQRLIARAGYELADPVSDRAGDEQRARLDLARRIAARIST